MSAESEQPSMNELLRSAASPTERSRALAQRFGMIPADPEPEPDTTDDPDSDDA